jgi:hypothetical protein
MKKCLLAQLHALGLAKWEALECILMTMSEA